MKIEVMSLKICNFKGIKDLYIDLGGNDCKIRGENGTGKTSIKDAFTWLLFGKDSLGRADFGIKPLDSAGDVIHQLETSVEAELTINGVMRTFRKTFQEKWTRQRGAAEATFTRNETGYYIDGVSKKKTEYTSEIGQLIKEDIFKVVTDPLYFNEGMNWKDRRSILIETCGEITDEDVIASNEKLEPLHDILQGRTVEDHKAVLTSSMKNINADLERIPIQINEAELAKPSIEELEIDYELKELLTKDLEQERQNKLNLACGKNIIDERRKLVQLEESLKNVGIGFNIEGTTEYQKMFALKRKIAEANLDKSHYENMLRSIQNQIDNMAEDRKALSLEWDKVFGERFTDTACPTCGRELPEEEVESRKKVFNLEKTEKLDRLEKANDQFRINMESCSLQLAEAQGEYDRLLTFIEGAEKNLSDMTEAVNLIIKEHEKDNERKRAEISAEIEEVKKTISLYESGNEGLIIEIDSKIESLKGELKELDEAIANKALIEKQDKRIAELKAHQEMLAQKYIELERELFLIEQFIVTKVNMLNERINSKFKFAKFKLFDKQINGGINEVCEVTYNGVPYKDLNNAMRINVGLDVINTISEHYGVIAPIIIDNAESVNQIFDTEAQQIQMYVSKDKKLTFEQK